MPSNISHVRHVRSKVEALRAALLTPNPQQISDALPGLEEAAVSLHALEAEVRANAATPADLRHQLKDLKNDLRTVAALVEHGATFYQGWAKMLAIAAAGYTPKGEAAPLEPIAANAISIRG